MTDSDQPGRVRIVLDASAIIAFCGDSDDVGEVIREIADDDGAAGLPMLCLAEARVRLGDHDKLELLARHPAAVILAPDQGEWLDLAVLDGAVGRRDASSAMLDAIAHHVDILTAQPSLYAGAFTSDRIIELPAD